MDEKSLEQLLDEISVHDNGDGWPEADLNNWLGVSTDDAGGIIAYFSDETHAYAFRLFLINAKLNPLV